MCSWVLDAALGIQEVRSQLRCGDEQGWPGAGAREGWRNRAGELHVGKNPRKKLF